MDVLVFRWLGLKINLEGLASCLLLGRPLSAWLPELLKKARRQHHLKPETMRNYLFPLDSGALHDLEVGRSVVLFVKRTDIYVESGRNAPGRHRRQRQS